MVRHQFQGLVVFGISWALTGGSLAVLHATAPGASSRVELIVLTVANLVATLLRFVLLRLWVFRASRRATVRGTSAREVAGEATPGAPWPVPPASAGAALVLTPTETEK